MPGESLSEKPVSQKPRKRVSEVQVMLVLTLLFIIGVAVYSVFPEGIVRQSGVTIVSLLVVWAMYGMKMPR